MRKRFLNILLFISLAFNIAFLGGSVYRFIRFRRFEPIHQRIHNEKVEEFMNKRKELGMPLVEDFHLAKDEFMKALAKENIDEEELQTIIDNLIYKQSMMEKEIGNSMIELRKELSSEEAKEVFGKFRKWMQPPEHMHREKNWPGPPHRK